MVSLLPLLLALLFYLVPYCIGRGLCVIASFVVTNIFSKRKNTSNQIHAQSETLMKTISTFLTGQKNKKTELHQSENLLSTEILLRQPLFFALGNLSIFLCALTIQYLFPLTDITANFQFSHTFLPAIQAIFIASVIINLFSIRLPNKKSLLHIIFPALSVISLSTVAAMIWNFRSPFPLNWDLYEHQTLVNTILKGSFDFFTSHLSDTFGFNSYPPIFHTLMAVSQSYAKLSSLQILEYWNAISFLHLVLISVASYVFAYALTRNRWVSILSCIIGTLTFESTIAFTSLFLLPQTLTAVMFAFAYSHLVLQRQLKGTVSVWWLIILVPTFILSHYVVGSLAAVIYIASYFYLRWEKWLNKVFASFPIVELGVMSMIGGVFASRMINLDFLNKGEAASYTFSPAEKIEFMKRVYGWELPIFVPLGIFTALRKQTSRVILTLLISFGFIAILLSEFPYVIKFYVLGRFFIHFLVALGIWSIIEKIKNTFLRAVSICFLTITLMILLILNSLFWKQGLFEHNQTRHVGDDEITAAQFLTQRYDAQKTLIVSDPATQYILEALSGINSAGGSFASTENRKLTAMLRPNLSDTELSEKLNQINDPVNPNKQKILLALSGRFFLWQSAKLEQQTSFDFNVWAPHHLTLQQQEAILSYQQNPQLEVVYSSPSLVIFELK
jgi:hypothetical protein